MACENYNRSGLQISSYSWVLQVFSPTWLDNPLTVDIPEAYQE